MKKSIKVFFIICTIVFVLRGFGYAACPSWIPITGTQYSMVMYGNVYVDGALIDTNSYVLGAFGPGGESDCRAVYDVTSAGFGYLTIVGDVNGETIEFRLCDNSTDEVFDTNQTQTFMDGDTAADVTLNFFGGCLTNDDCDDGNACNGTETCNMGTGECEDGTPVVCEALDQCHDVGTCDPGTGVCSNPAKPDGTACGSSNDTECDNPDTCLAGVCENNYESSGAPCGTQGVECQVNDTCDGSGLCTDNGNVADGTACGSSNDTECDNPDTCLAGACADNYESSGAPCGDQGVACHVDDTCDGSGSCTDNGNVADGTECNDNEDCTHTDICTGGVCEGTSYICEDDNECTDNICLGDANCNYVNNTASCDDGNACTENDTCSEGVCVSGTQKDCDDSIDCTEDSCDPNTGCSNAPDDDFCDDGVDCTEDSCDPNTGCSNAPDDDFCDDDNVCTDDSCDPNTGCINLPYFENDLKATGQENDYAEVTFGLDPNGDIFYYSENWSVNDIVALHLIDANVIADPDNIDPANDYLTVDLRRSEGIGQSVAWYIVVDNAADPTGDNYYPVLSWDLDEDLCAELDGNPCVYELRRGLGTSGTVLVADMTDTDSYQTVSQDGDPNQNFTILMTCKPPVKKAAGRIFPWPGVYPGALGWGGSIPFSAGFPGGLPYPMTSGYAPGLSIPSFPGTYPGFTYPGSLTPWTSNAWTSYVPRFPVTFPAMGIFSPLGQYGWPINYWTGFPRSYNYKTGWFYTYH